jgi:hypothetical protein
LRILVLSFYYEPDLSAGSFRTTALVNSLLDKSIKGVHIDVVTTLPNRYKSFTSEAPEYEQRESLEIFRVKLPVHKSGFIDQSKAFVEYAAKARKITLDRDYDLIFATSGRLMTAVLGAWIASRKKTKLYLDIRDIFVDTIKDVLPRKITFFIKPGFIFLEKWAINKADKVNLISEGFSGYFHSRYPHKIFSFFTNGIDKEFIADRKQTITTSNHNEKLKVIYAGNMGEGQGLHKVIPHLAKRMQHQVHFILIGDGGRKLQLQIALDKLGCQNVELRSPIGRDDLIVAYNEADVLFMHLNDYEAFRKVLPSKVFEYAALGKPIWAGVSGYAAKFLKEEVENAVVFQPCSIDDAVHSFDDLIIENTDRTKFIRKFARVGIMDNMSDEILSIAKQAL